MRNDLENFEFCHLHNHTQFSMLQLQSTSRDLVDLPINNVLTFHMNAVAITDKWKHDGSISDL